MEFARTRALLLLFMNLPTKFSTGLPHRNCRTRWVLQFETTEYFSTKQSLGRPHNHKIEAVERILQLILRIAVAGHIKNVIMYIKSGYNNKLLYAVFIIL